MELRLTQPTLLLGYHTKRKMHMPHRNYQDIVGGILLIILGLFAAFYAANNYNLGRVASMGPGMFPTVLGYLLAALGALIVFPALFRPGPPIIFHVRPFIACSASILLFAVGIKWLGMIPAIMMLVITACMADKKLGWKGILILAVGVTLLAMLIFTYGFGMTLQWFKWGEY